MNNPAIRNNDPEKSVLALVFLACALVPAALNWLRHGQQAAVTQITLYSGVFLVLVFTLGLMLLARYTVLTWAWLLAVATINVWLLGIDLLAVLALVPLAYAIVTKIRGRWAAVPIFVIAAAATATLHAGNSGLGAYIPGLVVICAGAITALYLAGIEMGKLTKSAREQLDLAGARLVADREILEHVSRATSLAQVDEYLARSPLLKTDALRLTGALKEIADSITAATSLEVSLSVADAEEVPLQVQNTIIRAAKLWSEQICAQPDEYGESAACSIAFTHRLNMATLAIVDDGSHATNPLNTTISKLIEHLGGTATVTHTTTSGTTLLVAIPTNPTPAQPEK